jgi:hypothetical protein
VEAIVRDEQLPGEQAAFMAVNAAIADGEDAVEAALRASRRPDVPAS